MPVVLLFGNSGSGKSTLAKRLAAQGALAHLDLDTVAWEPTVPPTRRDLGKACGEVNAFLVAQTSAVVEGCYADLLQAVTLRCTQLIFLNPGVQACLANARARPWEPHKYASQEAQDANLDALLGWISDYETRADDVFSLAAHRSLFDGFRGWKLELTHREDIARFSAQALIFSNRQRL